MHLIDGCLPISVIIRTLNEEKNIENCIKSCRANHPVEIIVSDGGSTDRTCEIAVALGVKVMVGKKGLVTQRDAAIWQCHPKSDYIAIVDADDQLDPQCLANLLEDLRSRKAQAVQACHQCLSLITEVNPSYWERAMLANLTVIHTVNQRYPELISMVGRPALYDRQYLEQAIQTASQQFTSASEDSDLSYRLKTLGARFTYGTGVCYRQHLVTFSELFRQWQIYGQGDAKFMLKHPERKWHVIYHQLITYPIVRALQCAKWVSLRYIPFFIVQGGVRFGSCVLFLIKRARMAG